MIVVVTVARRREKDTGDRIGAHEHVHAPLGFRKGWDTLSSRPVNSSFRSSFLPFSLSLSLSLSFFFLVFFLSFARSFVLSASLSRSGAWHTRVLFHAEWRDAGPKTFVGLFPKGRSDLRSRVQHFSPHYAERRRVSKPEMFASRLLLRKGLQ